MMQNKLPVGILKVDYSIGLMGEDIINSPAKAITAISERLTGLTKECGILLCLDIINRPICAGFLGTGDESTVTLSAKEITQFALLTNAAGCVLIHNHPANGRKISSLRPSPEDVKVTEEISKALSLFGVNLQDHIIVNYTAEGDKNKPAIYSMRSKRAYKMIFNHETLPATSYTAEQTFSGPNVINTEDNLNENNSASRTSNDKDRSSFPSL